MNPDKKAYMREYMRKRNEQLRAEGKCCQCKQPLDKEGLLCSACCEFRSIKQHLERIDRMKRNVCTRCQGRISHADMAKGLHECDRCRKKRNSYERKRD